MKVSGPFLLSKQIRIFHFVVKEYIQQTRQSSQSCSRSLQVSQPGSTALKAHLISIIRREAFQPLNRASSILQVRHIVRSIDKRRGRALNYQLLMTYKVTASYNIFRASSVLSPLPSIERRAIRQQDRGDKQSVLFGFGIIAKIAVQKQAGWCL